MDKHYPHFRSPQQDLRDDSGDMAGVAICLSLFAAAFVALGVFIGWLAFAPLAMASEGCGSVESCMVRAEQ